LRGSLAFEALLVGDQGVVEERDGRPWRQLVPLGNRVLPELLEDVAQSATHVTRGVHVDGVHAAHGMAAAVHLEHLVHV
jgi:hypothetical protein